MTDNEQTKAEKSRACGPFAVAMTIYFAGVLAFSAWLYMEHRSCRLSDARFSGHLRNLAVIEGLEMLFLLAMAFPLIALYVRAKTKSAQRMEALNEQLKRDNKKLKTREAELEDAIRDLERFNAVAVGRETRVIELKTEVNTLLEQLQQEKRYTTPHTD